MPHSIIHGDARFAYFNKMWDIPILAAGFFFFASVFNVRTCSGVHARRFDFSRPSNNLRIKKTNICSRKPLYEKPVRWRGARAVEKGGKVGRKEIRLEACHPCDAASLASGFQF